MKNNKVVEITTLSNPGFKINNLIVISGIKNGKNGKFKINAILQNIKCNMNEIILNIATPINRYRTKKVKFDV